MWLTDNSIKIKMISYVQLNQAIVGLYFYTTNNIRKVCRRPISLLAFSLCHSERKCKQYIPVVYFLPDLLVGTFYI